MKLLFITLFVGSIGQLFSQSDSSIILPTKTPPSEFITEDSQITIIKNKYLNIENSKIVFENGLYKLIVYYKEESNIMSVTEMGVDLYIDSTYTFSSNFDTLTITCENRIVLLKNGVYNEWYESGALKVSGRYLNDVKDGVWIYYDLNGAILKREEQVSERD